jgi:uncharacterized protein YqgC (DUF456 family)
MSHLTWVVLSILLLLPGVLMSLVPLLPTFWYLLAVAAIFATLDGFTHLTVENFIVLVGLFLLSILVDWSAGVLGAKFGGAGWRSLFWGIGGAVIGTILLFPFGAIAGLFLGVLGSELSKHHDAQRALRAASGALIGTVAGVAINVILAIAFVTLFIIFAVL